MQSKTVILLAIALGMGTALSASDTFDMGKVKVMGKDAQSGKIDPSAQKINFTMGERSAPMPELVPEVGPLEFRPMTEKQALENFHRENRDELSVAAGIGTRGSNELIINGKGTKEGYVGDVTIRRESRDGFNSFVDTRKTGLEATVSSTGEGSYSMTAGGEYAKEKYAQRGLKTNPSPDAGIENGTSRIWVKGNSTLEDGAFFTGKLAIDSLSRDITNSANGFNEEQTAFSVNGGAAYSKKLTDNLRGRAAIDLKNDKLTVSSGAERKLTKTVVDLGGEFDLSDKSMARFGFKKINLMSTDKTAPYASLDYRFNKPLQLVLSYDEDLGNDSMEKIFMPSRYVVSNALRASRIKTMKGAMNYRNNRGDTMGIELFSQKENDAIEYIDFHDPGKAMLTSNLSFVNDARRKGTALKGSFRIEDNFKINIKTTFQTPENNTSGRRLSYEPKRILDVGFNYTEGKFMVDFSRRAEFDRQAHTPTASFDADDYSRSDLAVRYKLNNRFSTYLKIKDLYDEAKQIQHNVPEEGRVSLAGIEAHF